jgi:hypothetical protein
MSPDVNVRAERAKPYGLRSQPQRGFALSARGFSHVLFAFGVENHDR